MLHWSCWSTSTLTGGGLTPLGTLHLLELVAVTSGPQIMFAQEVLPLVWGVLRPSVIQGVAKDRRCLRSFMMLYNA